MSKILYKNIRNQPCGDSCMKQHFFCSNCPNSVHREEAYRINEIIVTDYDEQINHTVENPYRGMVFCKNCAKKLIKLHLDANDEIICLQYA